MRSSLAEAEKQAEGDTGANAALWHKLQQANGRLAHVAMEAMDKENSLQRKLGLAEHSRQMAEFALADKQAALLQTQASLQASSLFH